MQATIDSPGVRSFTTDLEIRRERFDADLEILHSKLEQRIDYYAGLCADMRAYLNQWAMGIFRGEALFDSEAETLIKNELEKLFVGAKQVAALGRTIGKSSIQLPGLQKLNDHIVEFSYILENWVTPQRAVSPGPRVKLSKATEQELIENLKKLAPLSSDFRSTVSGKVEKLGTT